MNEGTWASVVAISTGTPSPSTIFSKRAIELGLWIILVSLVKQLCGIISASSLKYYHFINEFTQCAIIVTKGKGPISNSWQKGKSHWSVWSKFIWIRLDWKYLPRCQNEFKRRALSCGEEVPSSSLLQIILFSSCDVTCMCLVFVFVFSLRWCFWFWCSPVDPVDVCEVFPSNGQQ